MYNYIGGFFKRKSDDLSYWNKAHKLSDDPEMRVLIDKIMAADDSKTRAYNLEMEE